MLNGNPGRGKDTTKLPMLVDTVSTRETKTSKPQLIEAESDMEMAIRQIFGKKSWKD